MVRTPYNCGTILLVFVMNVVHEGTQQPSRIAIIGNRVPLNEEDNSMFMDNCEFR